MAWRTVGDGAVHTWRLIKLRARARSFARARGTTTPVPEGGTKPASAGLTLMGRVSFRRKVSGRRISSRSFAQKWRIRITFTRDPSIRRRGSPENAP